MSYIRYKKVGDTEYAYEITAYWDKKKQHSLQKSKYLGIVLDKEAGIFQHLQTPSKSSKLIIPQLKLYC